MKKNLFTILALLLCTLVFSQTENATKYVDKANLKLEKNDYQGAMATLNYGILLFPDSVKLYDMRGALYETFGMFPEAIEDFSSGIEKADDVEVKAHLLSNRGGSKARIRNFEGAYEDLIHAIQLDSTNIGALNNLATICGEVDKPEQTLIYLHKIISLDPDYVPAYINLGFKHQEMGEHPKALEYFDMALKLDPEEAFGYSNRSFSRLKTNDLVGAMEDINRSRELFSTNSFAYKTRALIYIEQDQLGQACEDLTKAEELGFTQQYGDEVSVLKDKYCQ